MGLLDKTINKTKSTFNATTNKLGETKEVSKLESQIKDERNKVKGTYETIGKEYYRWTYDNDEEHKKTIDSLVAQINESRTLIEQYEAEIEEIRQKGKEERYNIKADADAKDKEIDAADEQKRADKQREKKEKDDLF